VNDLISVIDDDASVRMSTKLLIESFGYRVTAFESAEDFLSFGELNDASCLLVDVHLPGMDGLELQSHLATSGFRVPIIFISAFGEQASRCRAMQTGAVAFVTKPYLDEELLQTIRSALNQ
jgi:FixJ family two-component response regulator